MPPLDPLPEFDLYAELGVSPYADAAAIERAWRAAVRSVHPDRARPGEEPAATARTARLNVAREWLSDPSKRARYDELRRPRLRVDLPEVDPLGPWPVRRQPRRSTWPPPLVIRSLTVSFVVLAVSALLAPVLGIISGLGFIVGVVGFGWFGLYAVTWVVVGVVYRRLDT